MRRLAILAAATLLAPTPSVAGDPIRLFNGEDLSGWVGVHEGDAAIEDVWSVRDGLLVCKGQPVGYIRTERDDFRDYTLTLQWRFPEGSEGGNSGVLVHTSEPGAIGIWPKSIEVQLFKDNAGDFWVIGTELNVEDEENRRMGRRIVNLTDGSERPVGEWNQMEIICQGNTIRVTVNGDLVNEATNTSVAEGAISLQSEGAPIEFREIVLTPLD